MKLLLLALLGLVAMAAAQDDPRYFEVLDEETDPDDIDPEKVEKLEGGRVVERVFRKLASARKEHDLKLESEFDLPPAYEDAVVNSSMVMFDDQSTSNEERDAGTGVSKARTARQILTNFYHCPHRTYLLRWFPVYSGGSLHKICFVPWAWFQAITYARCSTPNCRIPGPRNGICRPSCYRRRRILVFCYNLGWGWSWSWQVVRLPTACRCSTC